MSLQRRAKSLLGGGDDWIALARAARHAPRESVWTLGHAAARPNKATKPRQSCHWRVRPNSRRLPAGATEGRRQASAFAFLRSAWRLSEGPTQQRGRIPRLSRGEHAAAAGDRPTPRATGRLRDGKGHSALAAAACPSDQPAKPLQSCARMSTPRRRRAAPISRGGRPRASTRRRPTGRQQGTLLRPRSRRPH